MLASYAWGGQAAINSLAHYLVEQTAPTVNKEHPHTVNKEHPQPTARMANPKGRLLEMGGSVSSECAGGPPHRPVFLAIATLGDILVEATGGSKKTSEVGAAE